jgi:glycine cleavage system H protein
MADIKYSREHEWVDVNGDHAVVGITEYAQEQLGDIVFVELPAVGASFDQGEQAAVIESVKAASEIYAPISGEITEINEALDGSPETINEDATGEGWLLKMSVRDANELDELMDKAAYDAYVASLE